MFLFIEDDFYIKQYSQKDASFSNWDYFTNIDKLPIFKQTNVNLAAVLKGCIFT